MAPAHAKERATLAQLQGEFGSDDKARAFEPMELAASSNDGGDAADTAVAAAMALSDTEKKELRRWINASYLDAATMLEVRDKFDRDGSVQLKLFLRKDVASRINKACCFADESDGIAGDEKEPMPPYDAGYSLAGWVAVGPSHKRRYLEYAPTQGMLATSALVVSSIDQDDDDALQNKSSKRIRTTSRTRDRGCASSLVSSSIRTHSSSISGTLRVSVSMACEVPFVDSDAVSTTQSAATPMSSQTRHVSMQHCALSTRRLLPMRRRTATTTRIESRTHGSRERSAATSATCISTSRPITRTKPRSTRGILIAIPHSCELLSD